MYENDDPPKAVSRFLAWAWSPVKVSARFRRKDTASPTASTRRTTTPGHSYSTVATGRVGRNGGSISAVRLL